MSTGVPRCRTVTVHTFRGDRTNAFLQRFLDALDGERNLQDPGPSVTECLLYAGHTGVSTDRDKVINAFNPDGGNTPIWQVIERLQRREAYPGIVRDDTAVFTAAQQRGLQVLTFDST